MSEENVEVVRRVFEAFNAGFERGDPGAVFDLETVADDLEWMPFPGLPGMPQSYHGREGFVEFMRTWTEDFEGWSIEYERLIDAPDDRVVALIHQSATGKESGAPVELHFGQVSELEDGRVIRIRNFPDLAQALEAAGLSEEDAHSSTS
jgi:ketosteroid isomerase-like protein